MKCIIYIVTALVVLTFCAWLFSHQPAKTLTTNVAPIVSNTLASKPVPQQQTLTTNAFIRPDSIDEDHWNELMLTRQLALSKNQPVEFYARVLDQDDKPVQGAKLRLKLTKTDEKMFATTNFFSMRMGDEVLIISFEMLSDSNGWIRFINTNGYFLDMAGLSKNGYLSSYPNGNFGGVHYKLDGTRDTYGGDIQLTNSLNVNTGYILHLRKIQDTNSAK